MTDNKTPITPIDMPVEIDRHTPALLRGARRFDMHLLECDGCGSPDFRTKLLAAFRDWR